MASNDAASQPTALLLRSPCIGNEDPYVASCSAKGICVILVPIIDVEFYNPGLKDLMEYIKDQRSFSGIIFTSKNSVAAFERAVGLASLDMQNVLGKTTVFVVGKATEQTLSKWNTKILGSDCGNASKLSDFIIQYYRERSFQNDSPFLFPCGEMALATLPERLSFNHVPIERFTVYKTVKHPDFDITMEKYAKAKIDAVMFFSPSGVRFAKESIESLLESNGELKLIAFGGSTKKEIEKYFLQCDGVSTDPTPESAFTAVSKAILLNSKQSQTCLV